MRCISCRWHRSVIGLWRMRAASLSGREGWRGGRARTRDPGVGIPEELLPRVFDAFTQAEQGLDRRRGGLGLGLALVKGIVELHGGEVHATNCGPGRGAEFSFSLPLEPHPQPVM